jgi:hypothetical protein
MSQIETPPVRELRMVIAELQERALLPSNARSRSCVAPSCWQR